MSGVEFSLQHVFTSTFSTDFFAPPRVKRPVETLFHTCPRYENAVSHRCCDPIQLVLSSHFCRTTGGVDAPATGVKV